jgi:hypothetical protein
MAMTQPLPTTEVSANITNPTESVAKLHRELEIAEDVTCEEIVAATEKLAGADMKETIRIE